MTTFLGWWTPAIHEPRKVGGGWMWLIPAVLAVGSIGDLTATKWGEIDDVGPWALWLAIGTLFVGFSEELRTRGLAIVGGRGSMHERWVWVFSGLIFGLLHVPNAFFGQSAKDAAQQVAFPFAIGLSYYVTRRTSGTLVVTVVLHAAWDYSAFIQGHSVDNLKDKPASIGGFILHPVIVMSIIAMAKILTPGDVVEPGGDQLAELSRRS